MTTSTSTSAAIEVSHCPPLGVSPSFPQRGNAPTPSVATAPKRTAAGRYKRLAVYTEGEDSDEGSDHASDSEGIFPKRLRRGTVITCSRSELTKDTGDSSDNPPPDVLSLLQSPTPSSRRSVDPSDDADFNPSRPQSPDRSSPSVDQEAVGRNTPSPTVPTTEKPPSSSMSPTGPHDVGATGTPTPGDVSPKIDLRTAATMVVPKFLTVVPKKGKTTIHSYLVGYKDPHFRNLLQVYVAFENTAAASGKVGSLSTTGRPPQVSWWIRSARAGTFPSLPNLRDYGSSVISWWSHLQPNWRKLDCAGSNRDNGTFDCLVQPGINGLLNVVILAYWWSDGLAKSEGVGETEGHRYRWFVADVSWVLSKLIETAPTI